MFLTTGPIETIDHPEFQCLRMFAMRELISEVIQRSTLLVNGELS